MKHEERREQRRLILAEFDRANPELAGEGCHAGMQDGECYWPKCPQERDGEPTKTGRHCPLDYRYDDDE